MPAPSFRRTVVAVVTAVLAAACSSGTHSMNMGGSGNRGTSASASRTIKVSMVDIGYQPADPIAVPAGTTVRFVFTNTGKVAHEGVIGDQAAQDAHDKEMSQSGMGGMNMHGPGEVSVDPGKTAELIYTFIHAGNVVLGCHYPGHYAAGMRIAITVT